MKITIILLFFFFWGNQTKAQKNVIERVLHADTCDITLHIKEIEVKEQRKIECDSCWYYSLSLDKILVTQGGKGEKILQGDYEEKYRNGLPKRKGTFHNGLKNGEWRMWDERGKLIAVENYQKGMLHGDQYYYSGKGVEQVQFEKGKKIEKRIKVDRRLRRIRKEKENTNESSPSKEKDAELKSN